MGEKHLFANEGPCDGDLLNFSDDASFADILDSQTTRGIGICKCAARKEDNQSFVKIAAALKNSGIPCPLSTSI